MAGTTETASDQLVLEPCKLQETGLEGVPEKWQLAMHMHQPCEGLYISCINGRPGSDWIFRAEGPHAFSINILLEGRMQTAFDDGDVLDAQAGSATLMATCQDTTGWDALNGKSGSVFRMVSIHMPQTVMSGLTGLQMDDLRSRTRASLGNQQHIDAFLGIMPASSSLQRVACDLIDFGCAYFGPRLSHNLYLHAKALEAIACFLRENLTQREADLPVPTDCPRLLEAHALLEQTYSEDWNVLSLARIVGLNEKRLQSGFRALFGCSVYACLTRIRINAAVALLQRGASVTETAASCGFASLSHFSRIFRNHTGVSPKQCALGIKPPTP
ncbi:MAG: AraC family transcriptional regulator [Azoarcus sp.]|jgi:AraC-like DNA-binding protein|nr:AraC family transcriptional regulator [Azoarcus sp.]